MAAHTKHPAGYPEEKLLKECNVKRTRGSGPGGQHRNKVETAIVITHNASEIIGQASERRSQKDNHKEALFRLRINLAIGYRRQFESLQEMKLSECWHKRIVAGRIQISTSHEHFPEMLAETLDILSFCKHDVACAALKIGCTNSQLIKFLKKETAAFEWVNRKRNELGLKSYR